MKEFTSKYYLPNFKCNTIGDWKIIKVENCIENGYFTNSWHLKSMFSLLKRKHTNSNDWDIWMSLSPSEIESQEIACDLAYGHTVVMGLGLGFSALNIAENKNVKKVSVIENDKDIISLFKTSLIANNISNKVMDKISIICSDSLTWKPDNKVDFLYIDIWLEFNSPYIIYQVKEIQKNTLAKKVYFWGQEVTIASNYKIKNIKNYDEKSIKKIQSILNIDIAIPTSQDYFNIVEIIRNKLQSNQLYSNQYSRKIYKKTLTSNFT